MSIDVRGSSCTSSTLLGFFSSVIFNLIRERAARLTDHSEPRLDFADQPLPYFLTQCPNAPFLVSIIHVMIN